MSATEIVSIRVSPETLNRIDRLSLLWKRNRSKTVSMLMDAALDREDRLIRMAMNNGVDIRTEIDRPLAFTEERERMEAEVKP